MTDEQAQARAQITNPEIFELEARLKAATSDEEALAILGGGFDGSERPIEELLVRLSVMYPGHFQLAGESQRGR